MANIDNVQLPDGSSYNIVDSTSGYATQSDVAAVISTINKNTIGLGNVDNTSDLNKPISTATQAALDELEESTTPKTDIAPEESTSTASQRHEIGDQFYFNGQLVTATAIIAQGATITLNGNCVLSNNVTTQLASKADVSALAGLVSKSYPTYGNSSVTFIGAFRSAFNSSGNGTITLCRLRSSDVPNMWGIFARSDSNTGIFLGVRQDSKVTAYITGDGGIGVTKLNSFA